MFRLSHQGQTFIASPALISQPSFSLKEHSRNLALKLNIFKIGMVVETLLPMISFFLDYDI